MKKTTFALAICALLSCSAFATNTTPVNGNTTNNQTQTVGMSTNVDTRITNDVRVNAAAYAGAASASDSKSNATSNSGGNSQAVTVTDSGKMDYSGSYTVKAAPEVAAGNVYPTSPCMGGTSVGGSGIGFGFSVGSSWTDDECGIRETARSFAGMDLKADALAILCSSKYAAVAPSCKK